MAHHKSAIKRIRQTRRRNLHNRRNKKMLKLAVKAVRSSGNYEEAMENFKKATSILDKVSIKGIIHKNTASNRKSSLARFVNSLKPAQA